MSADALLPAPEVVRCRGCHRVCRHGTVQGYGPRCAEERGLVPHRVRVPRPRGETADGPDLFNHNQGETMQNSTTQPLGYIVLLRENDRWCDNWDGTVHDTPEAGAEALGKAVASGYDDAVLTAAVPVLARSAHT